MPKRLPGKRAVIRVCREWSRRLALGAGLLLGSGTLAGCDDQTAVEQRVENARALVQQGDTRLAIAELKHALQEVPEDADLRLMLGKLYLGRGDLPYAEKELSRAKALGLESPELMLALGDLWLRQNHEAQLLDELAPRRGWPEDAQAAALGLRARAYLSLDDPQRARSAYQAILELDPDSIDARIGLVRLAMRAGDPEAGALLADALRAAPDHPTLLGLSGDLAFQLTRYPDAVGMYRKQLEAAPDKVAARLALAEALIAAGELREAEALLDQFLAERPGNGLANYLRAAAAFQAGHVDIAQVHSGRAVAAIPTHVPSMFLAGASNYALGRLEAAHRNLTKVLARDPDHAQAQSSVGCDEPADRAGAIGALPMRPIPANVCFGSTLRSCRAAISRTRTCAMMPQKPPGSPAPATISKRHGCSPGWQARHPTIHRFWSSTAASPC